MDLDKLHGQGDSDELNELDELDELDDFKGLDKLDDADEFGETDDLLTEQDGHEEVDSLMEELEKGNEHITFTVFLAADKMTAYIRAQDYSRDKKQDNSIETDVIYNLLKENNVTYGIDDSAVAEYCLGNSFFKDFELAKGKKPQRGEDGSIEYFFNTDVKAAPRENVNGIVDYKELGAIRNVDKGDVLCVITPPTDGEDGINVLGDTVKAVPGKPATINYGKGVAVSDDGLQYSADVNGMIEFVNGTVEVKEVYTVPGDVGPDTGNIRFNGAVIVQGSVLSDYSIFANGDIIVNGYVEKSFLNSTANIVINNGINGMKKGFLKAQGNITVKFAEMAKMVAGGNVYCDYCINCEIRAGDAIIAKGKKGSLLGGNYIAGAMIDASTIGSTLNIPMEVQIIPDWKSIRNLEVRPVERIRANTEIIQEQVQIIQQLQGVGNSLEQEIARLSRTTSIDSAEDVKAKKAKLRENVQKKANLQRAIDESQAKCNALNQINNCEGCSVIARKTIHTGVSVVMGSSIFRVNGHKESQTFVQEDGQVKGYNITAGQ